MARLSNLGCALEESQPDQRGVSAAAAANGVSQCGTVSASDGAAMGRDCGTCGVDTEMYASPGLKPPLIRIKIAVIPEAASAGATGGADTAARGGGSKDGFRAELQADEACTKDGSSLSGSVIPLVAASGASADVGSGGGVSDGVCYPSLMRYLRQYEGVRYLDVSAGGVVIGGMMRDKLIDEVRCLL